MGAVLLEARRLDGPGLHAQLIRARGRPHLLHLAELDGLLEVGVHVGDLGRGPAADHVQLSRPGGVAAHVGEGPARHVELAAGVRPARAQAVQPEVEHLHAPAGAGDADPGAALVDEGEVERALIDPQAPGGAVQLVGQDPRLAPGQGPNVDLPLLMPLPSVVEAGPEERPRGPIQGRASVGSLPEGELGELSVRDLEGPQVRVVRVVVQVLAQVGAEEQGVLVGPHEPAAVVGRAVGQLPRGAPHGLDHEHLAVLGVQVPAAVGAVAELLHDLRRVGPLGPLGLLGHGREGPRLPGHVHGERDPAPVRGPHQGAGGLGEPRDLAGRAVVHPAHEDLGAVVVRAGHVGDVPTVR